MSGRAVRNGFLSGFCFFLNAFVILL